MIKNKNKILICGEARHGKDTVAELLFERIGYTFRSSSEFVGRILYDNILKEKYGYETFEECFADRVNHRDEWYDLICEYNKDDKSRTAKEILSVADIYVGMRDDKEFLESENLFDLTVWVDATLRLPSESSTSNKLTRNSFRYEINNNGTYEELLVEVDILAKFIENLSVDIKEW